MLVYQRVLGISSSQLTSCHIFQRGKGFTTKQKYMINYAIMWQIQCSSSPSHHHFKEFFVHHSQMVGLWHWVSTRWSFHCHVDRGNISSTPPYIKCLCYKHDKRKASVCRWWDISCNVLTHKNITNYKHMYIFFWGQNLLYIYSHMAGGEWYHPALPAVDCTLSWGNMGTRRMLMWGNSSWEGTTWCLPKWNVCWLIMSFWLVLWNMNFIFHNIWE